MVSLNSTAFVAVTGNGLTVSEDLGRRFLLCELDARCEDPELRPFPDGFLKEIKQRRAELLTAALTIWRWGRQAKGLTRGKPLGSFEIWAEWCRDPLVALGCCDPVERIEALKANDPYRQRIAELFRTWWEHHGPNPVKANELATPVKTIADPQERGRRNGPQCRLMTQSGHGKLQSRISMPPPVARRAGSISSPERSASLGPLVV